jgi:hypothetical protein
MGRRSSEAFWRMLRVISRIAQVDRMLSYMAADATYRLNA